MASRKMPEGKVRFMMDVTEVHREAFKLHAAKKGIAPNELFAEVVELLMKEEIKEVKGRSKKGQ